MVFMGCPSLITPLDWIGANCGLAVCSNFYCGNFDPCSILLQHFAFYQLKLNIFPQTKPPSFGVLNPRMARVHFLTVISFPLCYLSFLKMVVPGEDSVNQCGEARDWYEDTEHVGHGVHAGLGS